MTMSERAGTTPISWLAAQKVEAQNDAEESPVAEATPSPIVEEEPYPLADNAHSEAD